MKAKDFDKTFDNGDDISDLLDLSSATRPGSQAETVGVDFPLWVIEALDQEAARNGVSREAIITLWISQRIERERQKKKTG